MDEVNYLIYTVLNIYKWAFIISVIMTWLVQLNVINSRSPVVYTIGNFLHRVTEPALRRIRPLLPDTGAVDISPLVAVLAIWFVQILLVGNTH